MKEGGQTVLLLPSASVAERGTACLLQGRLAAAGDSRQHGHEVPSKQEAEAAFYVTVYQALRDSEGPKGQGIPMLAQVFRQKRHLKH